MIFIEASFNLHHHLVSTEILLQHYVSTKVAQQWKILAWPLSAIEMQHVTTHYRPCELEKFLSWFLSNYPTLSNGSRNEIRKPPFIAITKILLPTMTINPVRRSNLAEGRWSVMHRNPIGLLWSPSLTITNVLACCTNILLPVVAINLIRRGSLTEALWSMVCHNPIGLLWSPSFTVIMSLLITSMSCSLQ